MPSTVEDVFAAAGLAPEGAVRWGMPVPQKSAGVYVVALTDEPRSLGGALTAAPIGLDHVAHLLEVRPELRLDSARPTEIALADRFRAFWLPDEVVLYIGRTGQPLHRRVSQYYTTPLGARRPHAGGWWLKILSILDELWVHYAATPDYENAEAHTLKTFADAVSPTSRQALHDAERVAPFANLVTGSRLTKVHGITGATGDLFRGAGGSPPTPSQRRPPAAAPLDGTGVDELRIVTGEPPATKTATSTHAPSPDVVVGLAVGELLCWGSDWVHRRTETFRFTGATTVRRQMAVDFELPEQPTKNLSEVQDMVGLDRPTPVPLTTLRKQALTDFDLFDEDHKSLPLLTSAQNGAVAGEALVALAKAAAGPVGLAAEFPQSVERALRQLAALPTRPAQLILGCLMDGPSVHAKAVAEYLDEDAKRTGERSETAQEANARYEALVNLENYHGEAMEKTRRMLRREPLRALARKLAADFIVLVELDRGEAYARRIIKLAYEEPVAAPRREREENKAQRMCRRLAERCCWMPKQFAFSQIAAGDAEGHHVEVVAPEGLDIIGASFEAWVPRTASSSATISTPMTAIAATSPRPGSAASIEPAPEVLDALGRPREAVEPTGQHVIGDENPGRGHLHLRALPPQAYATARVQLRADPSGLLNAAVLVALVIAAVLFWGQERYDNIEQEDAAAAILLAIPTLLAAYVARPGEPLLVSLLLTGVRFLVAVSGALMFIAAASVAYGYAKTGQLGGIWCVVKWASLVPLVALAFSSVAVRWPARVAGTAHRAAAPLRWGRVALQWLLRKAQYRRKSGETSDSKPRL